MLCIAFMNNWWSLVTLRTKASRQSVNAPTSAPTTPCGIDQVADLSDRLTPRRHIING